MKLIHAYCHQRVDYINNDDVICLNRTLLPIILDIKGGLELLMSGPTAPRDLNVLNQMQARLRSIQTRFEADAKVIFYNSPAEMEKKGYSDSLKDKLQTLQMIQYSDLCSKQAGLIFLPEIGLLVQMMYLKGWIANLNLVPFCKAQVSCKCKLFDGIEAGPEARQRYNMVQRQIVEHTRQALLGQSEPQATQQDKHSEHRGHGGHYLEE